MKAAIAAALGAAAVFTPVVLAGAVGVAFGAYQEELPGCAPNDQVDVDQVASSVERAAGEGLSDPAEQVPNAIAIEVTGEQMEVPRRGREIALATALQESGLRNLDYGDRDSVGLFQQRPSQGWGSVEQLMDPVYAATRFYDALLEVPGWQELPLTEAAQAVQRSAYPNAYARWEPLASALQRAVTGLECERPQ